MKIFLCLMMVSCITVIKAAPLVVESTLQGIVLDKSTLAPLPGVAVFIPELNRGTVTDEKGVFSIASLPHNNLTLQVTLLGYLTIIKKISPEDFGNALIIEMEKSTTTMDEVVVSGAYVMSRENSPIAIEKINQEELLKMPSPSLMTSLSKIPGINEVSLGPGIGKPVIRGLSFSRVLSVYQGARFENQQWGADHGLGLNETGISAVEIIKGPASIIYGSGAMAGVIHLVEAPDAAIGNTEGDANVRAYSNNLGVRTEVGLKGASAQGVTWNFRGAAETYADYKDGSSQTIGNTRFNTQNLKAGMGLQKKWGDTRIRYSYLNQRLGLINETEPDELVTSRHDRSLQLPFQQVQDHFINSETNIFLSEDRVKILLGYHWNIREEIETHLDKIDLGLVQGNFVYDLRYYKSLHQHLEAILGVQGFFLRNRNSPESIDILIPDAEKDDRSVFGLLNHSSDKWTVQGGLRYDYRKIRADASGNHFVEKDFNLPGQPISRQLTRRFGGLTASAGATFKPGEHWRLRLNLASGFRAPDLAELFSYGPHPGTSRFEAGDASFQREQNLQADLGLRYQNSEYTISAEGFYNHINHYLFIGPTDEMRGDLSVWRFEQDNARLYGGEAFLKYHPSSATWFSSLVSFSKVTGIRSDNSYLPYIPSDQLSQEVAFKLPQTLGLQHAHLGLTGSWHMTQRKVAALEEVTPGYFLLGMNFGTVLFFQNQKVDVFFAAKNLLNKQYLNHLSLYRSFDVHQQGRNLSLHLKYHF